MKLFTGTKITVAITKLALGTTFYSILIAVAYFMPTAGGMMLTFPALNGLALAAAQQKENVEGAARTMLLMPVLNASLCVLYIFAFLWIKPDGALLGLIVVLGMLWAVVAGTIIVRRVEIPPEGQTAYIVSSTTFLLVWAGALLAYTADRGAFGSSAHLSVVEVLSQNGSKIGLFALCLSLVILISDFFSHRISSPVVSRLLGAFGGFPLVPFFGLYSVAAAEGRSAAERLSVFEGLATTVWLGPIIAFGFIVAFSAYLRRRALYDREGRWVARFALAIPFWLMCLFVIGAVTAAIEFIRR